MLEQFCKKYDVDEKTIIDNPAWKSNTEKQTFAMYLGYQDIIAPKQFYHDPKIQDDVGATVAVYLEINGISTPKEWQYDPLYKLGEYNITTALMISAYGKIPSKHWCHDPEIKSKLDHKNVRQFLQGYGIPIPNEWYDEQYQLFNYYKPKCVNDILYGIISDRPDNINPGAQYEYGYTAAMILIHKGINPPEQWYHDPLIKNDFNCTVALLLASKGIIPPQQWYHDPNIVECNFKTVEQLLMTKNVKVPQRWKMINRNIQMSQQVKKLLNDYCRIGKIQNQQVIINYPGYQLKREKVSFPMFLASQHVIPPKEFYHDPQLEDMVGSTVALLLEGYGIQTPKIWQYDPEYRLHNNQTTAMAIAETRRIPPEYWNHDPTIQRKSDGNTVGLILALNGIVPPQQWMHDPDMINDDKQSLRSLLKKHNYLYLNNKFVFNAVMENKQDICQICLEVQQEFVQTVCGDKVCSQCLKTQLRRKQYNCPICRKLDWIIPINKTQYQQYIQSYFKKHKQ